MPVPLSTVHLDYCFFVKRTKEESEDAFVKRAGAPILVAYDSHTKLISADYVSEKGVNMWSVRRMKSFVERLGHKKIIIRSDQELAIIALRKEFERSTHVEIVHEESMAYDSQSNGVIEASRSGVREQFRTLRDSLETRLRIQIARPITPRFHGWSHTPRSCSIGIVWDATVRRPGRDGKGDNSHEGCVNLGSLCLRSEQTHAVRISPMPIHVGRKGYFSEFVMNRENISLPFEQGEQTGVIKCRDVVRRTDQERWNRERFDRLVNDPMSKPSSVSDDPGVKITVRVPRSEEPLTNVSRFVSERRVRRFAIDPQDVKERGLWNNCTGCRMIRD